MNVVSDACKKANKPLYVGADSMVKDGGFLSVGIDYKELGKETAKIVDKVLKGNKVENIPVKVFKTNLKIYVNTTTKDKLWSYKRMLERDGIELFEKMYNVNFSKWQKKYLSKIFNKLKSKKNN